MNIVSTSRPRATAALETEGDVVATAADPSADPALPPEDSGTTGAGPSLGSSQFDPFGTGGASFSFGDGSVLMGGATTPGGGASGIFPGALPSSSDGALTETQCTHLFQLGGAVTGLVAGAYVGGVAGAVTGFSGGGTAGELVGGLVCGSILADSGADAPTTQTAGDADAGASSSASCTCPTPTNGDTTVGSQDTPASCSSAPINTDSNVSTGTCGGNNDGSGGASGGTTGGGGMVGGGGGGSMVDPSGDSGGGGSLEPGAPIHGLGPSESTSLESGANALGFAAALPEFAIGLTGMAPSWMTGIQG